MEIEFGPEKRRRTLGERGLDMARAGELFDGPHLIFEDNRRDYGEPRLRTLGLLSGRMVHMVWTPRGTGRRIVSLRMCNERERKAYGPFLAPL